MAERKVLIKYYPPDFDPSKLPRCKKPKDMKVVVRMMLPFTVNCNRCGEWINKGKKFNSRMEEVPEDKYLSIRVWRFYYKCTNCSAECSFKTDPKNSDYIAEYGASRLNEPWREAKAAEAEYDRKKAEEERDVMLKLENRTEDSRRELEIMDAIEEIKEMNARRATYNPDALLDQHSMTAEEKQRLQDKADDLRARQAFESRRRALPVPDDVIDDADADFEDSAEIDRDLAAWMSNDDKASKDEARNNARTASKLLGSVLLEDEDVEEENSEEGQPQTAPSIPQSISFSFGTQAPAPPQVDPWSSKLSVPVAAPTAAPRFVVKRKQTDTASDAKRSKPAAVPAPTAPKAPSAGLSSLLGYSDDDE
jgi:hypothetical protein